MYVHKSSEICLTSRICNDAKSWRGELHFDVHLGPMLCYTHYTKNIHSFERVQRGSVRGVLRAQTEWV